jgi:hypothetical protein
MGDRIEELAKGFLATLNRVPDDIVLETATRDLELTVDVTCLCGWFARQQIGRMLGVDGDEIVGSSDLLDHDPRGFCARKFGGTDREWRELFLGVVGGPNWNEPELIAATELAFTDRVIAATEAAHVR